MAGDLISPRMSKKPKLQTFTINLPYGAKKTVFFVPEKTLRKTVEDVLNYRNMGIFTLNQFKPL